MSRILKSILISLGVFWLAFAVQANATDLKMISTITVPGEPLDGFDISYIDQANHRYYLADRSNKAIDIVDTLSGQVIGQIPGFITAATDGDNAGPNGVMVIGKQAWAGDSNGSVKVMDLATRKVVDTLSTGGKNRADEVAYDPTLQIFAIANDADDPPFITLISTKPDHKILHKIVVQHATGGIEQTLFYAPSGKFMTSIPELDGNPSNGAIAIIDPATGTIEKMLPITDCRPSGLARGPDHVLVVGCNAGAKKWKMAPVTMIINADTGATIARVAGIGAADEVAYSAKNGQYYITARKMPDGAVLGVIDANTNTLVQKIPTGGNSHSVAVSEANGHVFVPLPKTGGPCGGCIAVFSPQ